MCTYLRPSIFALHDCIVLRLNSADIDAIIATADPGDYGDKILVAMNVEITETGESTDRAAAVRDAGAKVGQPICSETCCFRTVSFLLHHNPVCVV